MQLKDRYLAKSGTSVVELEDAALTIALEGKLPEHKRVMNCRDVEIYQTIYGESLAFNLMEDEVNYPDTITTEEDYAELVDVLMEMPRFSRVEASKAYQDRLETELSFFDRSYNIKFLLEIHELIEKFKRDNVVWGVGRGSSCASLILFLLDVHDIDPVKYKIPFFELTKGDVEDD